MAQADKTYSQKRLEDAFSIYLLLSEPMEFAIAEVMEAVATDYPTVPLPTGAVIGSRILNSVGMEFAFLQPDRQDMSLVFRACARPYPNDLDWETMVSKSRHIFPDAALAVERRESMLCISVYSVGTALAERFEAARLMTCIGAVFAKLPNCLGVYFPSADMILPPKAWVAAADEAVAGKFPVIQWINLQATPVPDEKRPVPVTASSIGLAAFLGCEVVVYLARIPPHEALTMAFAACLMLAQMGHRFRDSDTFGMEDSDEKYRIRFQGEGVHGVQTDVWALLHPSFPIDEVEMFGPRLLRPPPPGIQNTQRGDEGWLAKLVNKVRA